MDAVRGATARGDVAIAVPSRRVAGRTVGSAVTVLVVTVLATSVLASPLLLAGPVEGLSEAGPLTEYAAPVVRALRTLVAVATVGALALAVLAVPAAQLPHTGQLRAAAGRWALLWCLASAASVLIELSQVAGTPLVDVALGQTGGAEAAVATQVRALVAATWAAGLVAVFAGAVETGRGAAVVLLLAVGGLVPPVLTGHAGHADLTALAQGSLVAHVIGISLWTGGLLALCAHTGPPLRLSPSVLARYSTLALTCYVLVAASGVTNVLARMSLTQLLDSGAYVVILLVKVLLFVALGAIGVTHRRRTLRRLVEGTGSFWSLAALEVFVMVLALGLAVVLTGTSPGSDGQPVHAAPAAASTPTS